MRQRLAVFLGLLMVSSGLAGCETLSYLDVPDAGARDAGSTDGGRTDGGRRDGGGRDAGPNECGETPRRYYLAEPATCAVIDYECPAAHGHFEDRCGCGCTCPESRDPNIDWVSWDPDVCAVIDFDCSWDSAPFSSPCGCGCVWAGSCDGPNPAGCFETGCPPGMDCMLTAACVPSSCECDPEWGWTCTDDCGGGTCVPEAPGPDGVTFELAFRAVDAPASIYVQATTGRGWPGWIDVLSPAGEIYELAPNCGLCPCSSCAGCPVCDVLPPEVAEVQHLESVRWQWSATTHPFSTCADGQACWEEVPLQSGRYVARFCYSGTATGVGVDHWVGPTTCDDIAFDWNGRSAEVRYEVCWCE